MRALAVLLLTAWVAGAQAAAPIAIVGSGVTRGMLESGDETLESGELSDHYTLFARPGQHIVIDLRAEQFDPYLLLVAPDDAQRENDDYEDDRTRAHLELRVDEQGTYDLHVTSYERDETGHYTLEILVEEPASTEIARWQGELTAADQTLETGEYVDRYEIAATPGQRLRIDLRSTDFDTYLIVAPPKREQIENDDGESTSHSAIDAEITERGTVRVMVTSYEPGELGQYELTVAELAPIDSPSRYGNVERIALDQRIDGLLEPGDHELTDGEYSDAFEFEGRAGQAVRIELGSRDFDTYLAVITPSEGAIQNDDYDGDRHRSVVEMQLSESGRFVILATSYESGETGAYSLSLTSVDPGALRVEAAPRGKLFGIFAGIGNYPGKDNDLVFTADDAIRLRDALIAGAGMRSEDQITLLDRSVTRKALLEALRELGRRAGPEDTFVFFFSGHGDRLARSQGPEPADPDGRDETLETYDGHLTDDELRDAFVDVGAGVSLILIDACYSGGFAKDLISVPGRMGMFSSEEDVTSSVAAKFQAGGYLAHFLAEGIAEERADADRDGAVTALELSQYVDERYRADVRPNADGFVRTNGAQTAHQRLVVDRGSIGPYDVLFR